MPRAFGARSLFVQEGTLNAPTWQKAAARRARAPESWRRDDGAARAARPNHCFPQHALRAIFDRSLGAVRFRTEDAGLTSTRTLALWQRPALTIALTAPATRCPRERAQRTCAEAGGFACPRHRAGARARRWHAAACQAYCDGRRLAACGYALVTLWRVASRSAERRTFSARKGCFLGLPSALSRV